MKAKVVFLIILFLLMLAVPAAVIVFSSPDGVSVYKNPSSSSAPPAGSSSGSVSSAEAPPPSGTSMPASSGEAQPEAQKEASFQVLDESSGKIQELSYADFLVGVVSAEMPASFETEALKAQAIASMTFFLKKKEAQRAAPDEALKGADFSLDFSKGVGYLTDQQLQEKWGDAYEDNLKRIKEICQEAQSLVLRDSDDALITAAYHAISGGVTEASADVFSEARQYLVEVPSPGDTLAPGYQTTVTVSPEDFKAKAEAAWPDIKLEGEPQTWIGDFQTTQAGLVKTMKLGSLEPAGDEIREVFSLRSANFDLIFSEDSFLFTVRGYGHGVGMSQYGANFMASQGAACEEILAWYYPGSKIERLSA